MSDQQLKQLETVIASKEASRKDMERKLWELKNKKREAEGLPPLPDPDEQAAKGLNTGAKPFDFGAIASGGAAAAPVAPAGPVFDYCDDEDFDEDTDFALLEYTMGQLSGNMGWEDFCEQVKSRLHDGQEDDYDDDLAEFENELDDDDGAAPGPGRSAAKDIASFLRESGVAVEETKSTEKVTAAEPAVDNTPKRPQFDVFKYAKAGNIDLVKECVEEMGVDAFVALRCNALRSGLHYAADAGSVELVSYMYDLGVSFSNDRIGLTPLDVAVLSGNPAVVDFFKSKYDSSVAKHRDASAIANSMPPPAITFAVSAPQQPPKADPASRFWTLGQPTTGAASGKKKHADPSTEIQTLVFCGSKAAERYAALGGQSKALTQVQSVDAASIATWAASLEEGYLGSSCVVRQHSAEAFTGFLQPAMVFASAMGNQPVGMLGAIPSPPLACGKSNTNGERGTVVAGALNVVPKAREVGVAAKLLDVFKNSLLVENIASVAVFYTDRLLPEVVAKPLTTVKHFRRIFNAAAVVQNAKAAAMVAPDLLTDALKLKADIAVRSYAPIPKDSDVEKIADEFDLLDGDSDDDVSTVVNFLRDHQHRAFSVFFDISALLLVSPQAAAAAVRNIFMTSNNTVFARTVNGTVVDMVITRDSKIVGTEVDVMTVVFACVTTLRAEKLPLLYSHLAQASLAHVLEATNTCGASEAALRKAMFDEVSGSTRHLYAVTPKLDPSGRPTPGKNEWCTVDAGKEAPFPASKTAVVLPF